MYADIMGFSHRVTFNNHEELKRDLQKFKQSWESRIKPLEKGGHLKSVQFSDSILLVVNGTNEKMFNIITKAAVCLVQSAMSLGFPIKGVIAQGKFSYDKDNELYFGLPLVEAYKLHEEIYYYGIVVHHSAEQTVKKYTDATKPYTKTTVSLNYKIPCSGVISRPAASTSCRSFFITSAGIHLRSTLTVRTRLRLRTMSIGA